MEIEIKSKESVYITINGTVYYIDDSTGEQIVEKWDEPKIKSNTSVKPITTVGELKSFLQGWNDNDQICLETTDLKTGDAEDLFPFYADAIEGIRLEDGSEVAEIRLCQLNNQ